MNTILFGLGRQGFRMLELLLDAGMDPVTVVDRSEAARSRAAQAFGDRVTVLHENPLDGPGTLLVQFVRRYDLVLDALPSFQSFALMRAVCEAGGRMVSVSFLEEDFMALQEEAEQSGALIIPDCGGAPGLSHLMAGYSVRALGGADAVVMKVGAIPAHPQPPFYHSLTWSVEDLVEEYIRPARVRYQGRIVYRDPFEDIRDETIQGLALESFLSDGARSFLDNYPEVPNLEERTLRYYGHMEFMRTLKDAGLLTRDPIQVDGHEVCPSRVVAAALEQRFSDLPREDRFVMEIEVQRGDAHHTHRYHMPYDPDRDVFGLVNAVAVTAVETAVLVEKGWISGCGVKPLELLATEEVYQHMAVAHRRHGALVERVVTGG